MIKKLYFDRGQDSAVEITHKRDGLLISYQALAFEDETPLEEITNLSTVLTEIKSVANELGVAPSEFIIEFQYDCGRAFCAVDKNWVLYLSLPIIVSNRQIFLPDRYGEDNWIFYHELMHAKEVLDGRFPAVGQIGQQDLIENLVGRLNDFANEGKLEAMGKPHQSKETAIENVYNCFLEDFDFGDIPTETMGRLTKEAVTTLCNKVWGKELTVSDAESIVKELLAK
jgi:hypothetical protein